MQNLKLPEVDTFESIPSTPSVIEDVLEESDDSEGEFCEIDNDDNKENNKNSEDNISDDEFEIMIDKTTDSCNFHQKCAVMCYNESDDRSPNLHPTGIKKIRNCEDSIITSRQCLFCGHNFYVLSCGKSCTVHTWNLLGRDLIVPCITQHTCSVMDNNISPVFEKLSEDHITYHPCYICLSCFEKNGGHVHIPTGKGSNKKCSHSNDITKSLQSLATWIMGISLSDNHALKENVLSKLVSVLNVYSNKNDDLFFLNNHTLNLLNPLIIKASLKLGKADKLISKQKKNPVNPGECFQFSQSLGKSLYHSRELEYHSCHTTNAFSPIPIYVIVPPRSLMISNNKQKIFGHNSLSLKFLDISGYVFKSLLDCDFLPDLTFNNNFNESDINKTLISLIPKSFNNLPPNITILDLGELENITQSLEFKKYLDIASDQSIFQRLEKYKEYINPNSRIILGQWHTNLDMCSVLITIFSGYGIYNIASALGVKYLTNFQKIVDYRAALKTLELIWTILGITLNIYKSSQCDSLKYFVPWKYSSLSNKRTNFYPSSYFKPYHSDITMPSTYHK
ncbi:15688_t:CDS:2 [Entrophospora sp. SA101]|nr:22643_t:CDS:2 [Entrophospora sp. SA101]CAJ0765407.1 15688_t:CDS:2 [Entrophospora sp. SA101]